MFTCYFLCGGTYRDTQNSPVRLITVIKNLIRDFNNGKIVIMFAINLTTFVVDVY